MSQQIIAYGATVERSLDGTTYTEIPEAKGVAVPIVETDFLDATSLDSPNGFREYVKGLKDAGVISVPCGYTADGYEQQLADQASSTPAYYRTTMKAAPGQATGDVFEFRGFPTPQLEAGDVGDLVGMTISIRTTGDVTWTKGTAAA
ncbi:phage tail tube protein [Yoonia sp.]|uniref:phage tail tube protein n=1 Tax=Yoonia sp. TaxID=2212373 RepID=UPI002E0023D5|nr:phage tail tube protein [Yoonia sp.]